MKMQKFRSLEMREAYARAGYREKFAMQNGNKTKLFINGDICYKWTYSTRAPYQDANGAIYNATRRQWIN